MDNPKIDKDGTKYWYNEQGQFHREDGPAIKRTNGYEAWYINGKRHRVDGPATTFASVTKIWFNEKHYREDESDLEYFYGTKAWCYHGEIINCSTQEEFEKIIKLRYFW